MIELKIQFPTQEAASEFASWLCESGEQSYWDWCDCGDDEDKRPSVLFDYHYPQNEKYPTNDERRYKDSKFCNDNIIRTRMRKP